MVISGLEKQLVQERICVIMRRRRFVAGAIIGALRTCHLLCNMCPPNGAVRQMGVDSYILNSDYYILNLMQCVKGFHKHPAICYALCSAFVASVNVTACMLFFFLLNRAGFRGR